MKRRRERPEDGIQMPIIDLLKVAAIDGLMYFAVPNGARTSISEAIRLKATGLVAGVADVVLVHPATGVAHFLEVKTKDGRLSTEQKAFRDWCNTNGVKWALVRSRDEAQDVLTNWGLLRVVRAKALVAA